jgi:hypothetical protein
MPPMSVTFACMLPAASVLCNLCELLNGSLPGGEMLLQLVPESSDNQMYPAAGSGISLQTCVFVKLSTEVELKMEMP